MLAMEIGHLGGASRRSKFLRHLTIALAVAQTTYWLYTFRLIAVNANPMGDGLEFVAIVPFGFIFISLVVPALLLGWRGQFLAFGAALAIVALILNVLLFLEIASELTGDGVRPRKL
jgi:hypothetical protein